MVSFMSNDTDILTDIYRGDHDDRLDLIVAACRERKRFSVGLSIGDPVRLTEPISPKYMVGMKGIVSKVNKTTVTVILEDKTTRFGASPRVPITCVAKDEQAVNA